MTTIRFTESQMSLIKQACPDFDFGGLLSIEFVLDDRGQIIDCVGKIEGQERLVYDALPELASMAEDRHRALKNQTSSNVIQLTQR